MSSFFIITIILLGFGFLCWATKSSDDTKIEEEAEKLKTKEKIDNEILAVQQKIGEISFRRNHSGLYEEPYIMASEKNRKLYLGLAISTITGQRKYMKEIFDYNDILKVEFIKQGGKVGSTMETTTDSRNMVGRAVIGGVLAGKVGAAVGAATAKQTTEVKDNYFFYHSIVLYTKNKQYPQFSFELYEKKGAAIEELYYFLKNIEEENATTRIDSINENGNKSIVSNTINSCSSIADELFKLNKLKNDGILSEVEFQQQKQKLLNK